MSTFPKDGSTFVVECIDRTAYRWAKYKPQGAKQMGRPGRWQKMVVNGDWHRWENCDEPVGEISPPAEEGPISKAFKQYGALDQWRHEVGKLHSQVDRKDAQIVVLTERLQAIIDWCDFAMKNADEFDSHGVRNLDGPILDAARAVLAAAE